MAPKPPSFLDFSHLETQDRSRMSTLRTTCLPSEVREMRVGGTSDQLASQGFKLGSPGNIKFEKELDSTIKILTYHWRRWSPSDRRRWNQEGRRRGQHTSQHSRPGLSGNGVVFRRFQEEIPTSLNSPLTTAVPLNWGAGIWGCRAAILTSGGGVWKVWGCLVWSISLGSLTATGNTNAGKITLEKMQFTIFLHFLSRPAFRPPWSLREILTGNLECLDWDK